MGVSNKAVMESCGGWASAAGAAPTRNCDEHSGHGQHYTTTRGAAVAEHLEASNRRLDQVLCGLTVIDLLKVDSRKLIIEIIVSARKVE